MRRNFTLGALIFSGWALLGHPGQPQGTLGALRALVDGKRGEEPERAEEQAQKTPRQVGMPGLADRATQ